MKVSELIEVLKTYPHDAAVVAAWDSGWTTLEDNELEIDNKNNPVVVFDVSEYGTYRLDLK